jgi:hypothetical protein
MADLERLKKEIADIARRPKAVRFAEIDRIVNQLGILGFDTAVRRGKETVLFRVEGERFGVCDHNPGRQHVKRVYVKEFLGAMANLGLYEE